MPLPPQLTSIQGCQFFPQRDGSLQKRHVIVWDIAVTAGGSKVGKSDLDIARNWAYKGAIEYRLSQAGKGAR